MIADLIILAGASFVQVFALGFQSRNVNHGNYGWAAATAFFIGISQGMVWHRIMRPETGDAGVLIYSLAGSVAIVASMWVHQRFIVKKPAAPPNCADLDEDADLDIAIQEVAAARRERAAIRAISRRIGGCSCDRCLGGRPY